MTDKQRFSGSRRTVLRRMASVPALGTGINVGTYSATAESPKTVVIDQGSTRYEVPVMSNSQTIEDFYNYYHAEAHTGFERDDTSLLFFWEDNAGVSLVCIHDKPYNGDGGQVTFDFAGLPSAGGWVVKDDSGDSYTSQDRGEWAWNHRHTDGGAYRGVDGANITITPSFDAGIDSWQLLGGTASNPTRQELDLSKSLTISVGTRSSPSLAAVSEEKLALAQRVSSASLSVDDIRIARDALETLQANTSAGEISEETAIVAVQRLKLGENVSETALVAPGPTDVINPENGQTLVGESRSQSYNLVDRFTDLFIEICVIAAVLGGAIVGGAAAVLGGAAVAAVNELYAAVKGLLGAISAVADTLGDLFDNDTIERFAEVLKQASDPEKAFASELLGPAKEKVRTDLRHTMEQDYNGSIEPVLERFADDVGGESASSGGDPDPAIGGTAEAARTTSERAIDEIVSLVSAEVSDLKTTNALTAVLDIAAGLAALGSVIFGIPGIVAGILAGVSTLMKAVQTVDTFDTFTDIVALHAKAVDGVRRGEVTIDA